jgi:hypothetical protein
MKRKQPPWDVTKPGEPQVLRLFRTNQYPDWAMAVNKGDLHPDFPQILVLDLTAAQYAEFKSDPVDFVNNNNLYPDKIRKPVVGLPDPPKGKGRGGKTDTVSYTVVTVHNRDCTVSIAGGAQ